MEGPDRAHAGRQGQGRAAALPRSEGKGGRCPPSWSPTHHCSLELRPRSSGASPLLSFEAWRVPLQLRNPRQAPWASIFFSVTRGGPAPENHGECYMRYGPG